MSKNMSIELSSGKGVLNDWNCDRYLEITAGGREAGSCSEPVQNAPEKSLVFEFSCDSAEAYGSRVLLMRMKRNGPLITLLRDERLQRLRDADVLLISALIQIELLLF